MRAPHRSLVFLLLLLVCLATGNTLGSSDSLPSRYLPFSILLERNLDLDELLTTAVLMRPTNVLVAAPLAVSALLSRPRTISRFLLLASLPLLFLAAYDTRYFGAPWSTGRNEILGAAGWAARPLANLRGLLVSPSRGLFVYSPVLVLAVAGLALGCLRRRPLFPALASSAGLLLIACSLRRGWWAGWWDGPRYLADILPVLCFALVYSGGIAAPWSQPALLVALPSPDR